MQTAKLPVRYELSSAGTTAGAQMQQICASVMSEGGAPPKPIVFSTDTGITPINTAGVAHLLSIRLQSAYNRATLQPIVYSTLRQGNGVFYYQLLLNPTLSGVGVTWTAIANTYAEKCVGNTNITVSGGYQLDAGYVTQGAVNAVQSLEESYLGINSSINGTSDIMTIYIYNIAGGTDNFWASFQFAQLT
jgi:hypothetical protein